MLELALAAAGLAVVLLGVAAVAVAILAVVFAPFDRDAEPLAGLHDDEDWR